MAVNLTPLPSFDVFMAKSKAPGIEALGDAISKIAMSPYEGQQLRYKLDEAKIANELNRQKEEQNKLILKYAPQEKELGLQETKAKIKEYESLAELHKAQMIPEQARFLEWYRKNKAARSPNQQSGEQNQPGFEMSMQLPSDTKNVPSNANVPITPKEIEPIITKHAQNQEVDNQIYYARQPQIGHQTGDPIEDAVMNKMFPDPYADMKVKQYEEDLKFNQGLYKEQFTQLNKRSDAAIRLKPQLTNIRDLYSQIKNQKGPFGGKLPALWSSAASEFDKKIQGIINENAMVLNQGAGGARSYDFTAAAGSKASRDMPETALVNLISTLNSQADESQDELAFKHMAESRKIKPEMAQQAYGVYKRHRPTMNQGNGQIYQNNAFMGTGSDFLTPEALRSIATTGDYIPNNQKYLQSKNITKNDIIKTSNVLKTDYINTIKAIEDPDSITDDWMIKNGYKLPRNVLLQIQKNKISSGGY
jgi:hypothetical protein